MVLEGSSGLEKLKAWLHSLPGKPSTWVCLALSLLVLWYDLAFRMTLGPVYTLPADILSHPRADAGWLSALVAMTLTGAACALGHARGSCAARGMAGDTALFAWAAVCCVGTLLVRLGPASLALTAAGGFVGGASFAMLAMRMASSVPLERRSQATLTVAAAALLVCSACKLVLCALNAAVLGAIVCVMPLLAALCARRARMLGRAAADERDRRPGEPGGDCASRRFGAQPSQLKSHLTEVGFCFLGLGLYMGIIGFANDGLEQAQYLSRQFLVGVGGSFLACALLAASMRANPDGPYVMLPILLGTSALVFIVTTTLPSDVGELLAHVAGRATDNLATVLAACTMAELACASGAARPHMSPASVVAICSAALLAGILGGGVLMSTVGLGTTSIVLVAVSLLYGALLSLGVSVQQRARDQYVIVRNPADMARIAQVQADALARELGTLTPRETEVLPYLLQHQGADAIAERLGISRNTVKTHIAHIYEKAGVNTRAQLVDLAAAGTVSL